MSNFLLFVTGSSDAYAKASVSYIYYWHCFNELVLAMKNRYLAVPAFATIFFLHSCNSGNPAEKKADSTPAADVSTIRGKELFQQRCIACHGLNGNYRNNNAADLTVSKIDSVSIVTTVINGRGAMPMFGHVMPDSDLAQLELYVKSLRK